VTGGAERHHPLHGSMAGRIESRRIDVGRADQEAVAARGDVGRRMAARGVAIERRPDRAGRDVSGRRRDDRDRVAGRRSGERPGARTVAWVATGHALVHARRRVARVIVDRRVALRAGRRGRNVIGGLRAARHVAGEGGRRRVALGAVTGRRVVGVVCRRTRVTPSTPRARDHAKIGGAILMTRRTSRDDGCHRGVSRHRERRSIEARSADLEAARGTAVG